jgi:hypothetical protein
LFFLEYFIILSFYYSEPGDTPDQSDTEGIGQFCKIRPLKDEDMAVDDSDSDKLVINEEVSKSDPVRFTESPASPAPEEPKTPASSQGTTINVINAAT